MGPALAKKKPAPSFPAWPLAESEFQARFAARELLG